MVRRGPDVSRVYPRWPDGLLVVTYDPSTPALATVVPASTIDTMPSDEAPSATAAAESTSSPSPFQQHDPEKATSITDAAGITEPSMDAPEIVDWHGPDDPEMPLNWPQVTKWCNVLLVATLTFLTPFASSMFAPAIGQVMDEMGTTDRDVGTFGVSIYLLGYAFGPLFLAPCSELYGRLPVYHICTALFLVLNMCCGLAVNMPMLVVFRLLTGVVGACPLTIGPGSVSDLFRQGERGRAMAVFTMPVLFGPSVGPAVGAYVSRSLGWRWTFWLLIIMTAVVYVISLIFQQETYPPALLRRKAARLRKETGNPHYRAADKLDQSSSNQQMFWTSIVRPIKMLALSPIILGLSMLTAVAYGILYLLFTTMSDMFQEYYGIVTNVGLVYLASGLGQFAGLLCLGWFSDPLVARMAKRAGGEPKPEYRLPPMLPGGAMLPIGLLIYGWSAHYRVFWFVPLIGQFLIGVSMITVFIPVLTYLVDAFTMYAASASAANTVFRSAGGALLPLAGPRMYASLGQGWANTLLAGISLVMLGKVLVAIKYGERIRTHPKYQLKL
ncbi:major facilitator superfamily domain-containing protein [Plectosphaerella plurivora]|uniref:Major facilitator superfamily domain-containing protein n=1 Tax=Plectosphaerella plurivora TaxID=936078 RepID=A0A9P8V7L1_9PEZI|nr:major facilitator superfamily domain-containing protein [Plectosphaerella plurivora]